MSITAALDAATTPKPPAKFQQHAEYDETGGSAATGPIRRIVTDYSELLTLAGLDPTAFRITGKVSQWTKTFHDKDDTYSFFFAFEKITGDEIDLPSLYAEGRRKPRARVTATPTERATVIVLADPQIGKTGRRGGTPELLERMAEKRSLLETELKRRRPSRIALSDAGDGFEGFESGGNPMFTNDLSLSQQMDAYGTELFLMVSLAHRFAPVDVKVCPSNHTAWRNGKQNLGNPQDDLGIFVHRQVKKITEAAGMDATWHFPADYDESVVLDLMGTKIGLVHGNQFAPGQGVAWWEKQTFGAQAVAQADVLIHGHYHSFSANVAGRNPVNQRQRWMLGAPTLDNGSDWYRTTAGRDSDPGLLVFDVTPAGFDLSSLTIL